jgi:branched-chain amino acid transport system ATP-binding protein
MKAKEKGVLLHVSGVSKRFGGLNALSGVDLLIREGETVALIGPNGAGKTTLFNIITGNLRPDSGSIHFLSKEISGLPMQKVARLGLVRVFQKPRVFPKLSVWENVFIGATANEVSDGKKADDRVAELLAAAGLFDVRNSPAGALPFGQKRLLELARAMAAKPSLLLLDEPAAGLSPEEQGGLINFIKDALASKSLHVLFIEHRSVVISQLASKVVILSNGRKVFEGEAGQAVTEQAIEDLYIKVGYVART